MKEYLTDNQYNQLKKRVYDSLATASDLKLYAYETECRDKNEKYVKKARKEAIEVCKDFYYPQSVVDAIKVCDSVLGISRIMKDAKKYI